MQLESSGRVRARGVYHRGLGGHAAEALAFGESGVSTAAADDLQRVRGLARRMVAQWGFYAGDSALGGAPVAWEAPDGTGGVGRGSPADALPGGAGGVGRGVASAAGACLAVPTLASANDSRRRRLVAPAVRSPPPSPPPT